MIRQGDVLLIEVTDIPATAKPVKRDAYGRLVLALGEVTGHAHVVTLDRWDAPPQEATLLTDEEQRRFLRLMEPATLVHEEHGAIALKPGLYQQVQQVEWDDSQEVPGQPSRSVRTVRD